MDNPRAGLSVRVLGADPEGHGFEVEYAVAAGHTGPFFPAHWHRDWTERFEILSGQARYRLGRKEFGVPAGGSVELPAGVAHGHPWNTGDEELRVRQTTRSRRPDPDGIRDTLLALAMWAWVQREGKVDRRGMPTPLQAAPLLRQIQRAGGYAAGVPARVQEVLAGILAGVADRRGYVAFDPRCLTYD